MGKKKSGSKGRRAKLNKLAGKAKDLHQKLGDLLGQIKGVLDEYENCPKGCCDSLPGGGCRETTEEECEDLGGVWHPDIHCNDPTLTCDLQKRMAAAKAKK